MQNPYNAPAADLLQHDGSAATYEPAVFSLSGRIGRVRYLAYTCLLGFTALIIANIVFAFVSFDKRSTVSPLVAIVACIPIFAVVIVTGVRRLNDMNLSGWWAVINLVPLICMLFWLWLALKRGDAVKNRYGRAPSGNGLGVVIAASLVTPIVALSVVGVVAAVAIPAYQSYMLKSKAAQRQGAPAPPAAPAAR